MAQRGGVQTAINGAVGVGVEIPLGFDGATIVPMARTSLAVTR